MVMGGLQEKLKNIDKKQVRSGLPAIDVGDNIQIKIKVVEGDKVRIHPFEGIVIRKQGSGIKQTFTVRKISFGEGVERTFPINSPVIESIKIVSKGETKRAKLFYLRNRVGKSARLRIVDDEGTPEAVSEPQQANN